jgi:signal transduction histidine kinase/sensor domain CHASE-containing protein
MTLTRKVLTRLSFTVIGVFLISASLFYFIILRSFLSIEQDILVTNTQRVKDALQGVISNINTKSSDWSDWDDTYDFVDSGNPEYVKSNLVSSSLASLDLNTLLIFDAANHLKAGLFIDIETGKDLPLPPALINYLTVQHPEILNFSTPHENRSGIIMVDNQPLLVSIRPVSDTNGTAPSKGAFIFGRFLDANKIRDISSTSHNQISVSLYSPGYQQPAEITTRSVSVNAQQATTVLRDIANRPVLLLTITRDRPIYVSALKTISYFTLIFILTIGIIIFTNFRIIHTTILTPLSRLIVDVNDIFTQKNFSSPIPAFDNTELTSLTTTINSAFTELGNSEKIQEEKIAAAEKTNRAMINILEDERHLEAQLKKQRDEAQTLINSMGEGLLVIDAHNKITAINPVAEKLLETTAAVSMGKNWAELVKTVNGTSLTPTPERSFAQVIETGKTIITNLADDHYYLTATGKKFPITSITAPIVNENKIVGAIKVFKDATPEKEEKANIERIVDERTRELRERNADLENAKRQISDGWLQIQQEKAKLTASLNNLPLGFILCDPSGNILMTNPEVTKLFNLEKIPENLTLIDSALKTDLAKQNANCIFSRQLVELKDVAFGARVIRILISPILVHAPIDQECIGAAILLEDITEAKVLERSRDEFFSIASHELRTPLTAIRGNTSMIMQYFAQKLDGDVLTMIQDIEEASVRLIGIVNDFLDVSRLEQGRIEFKKEAFNPIDLIHHVLNDFQSTSSQQKVQLELDPACTSSPSVFADQDRTRQVIINLIGNAMKFSEGGKVSISLAVKDNFVEVSIADNGRGIPLENQKLLFRKFQQAGDSLYTRDTSKGTGLGLYVSKLIVEGQGGKIYLVKSAPESGSVFAFTLPILQTS